MAGEQLAVNVLILRDRDLFVAQCLEYDIAVQGSTWRNAISAFKQAIVEQAMLDKESHKELFAGIPAAPVYYIERFNDDSAIPISQEEVESLPVGSSEEKVAKLLREVKVCVSSAAAC